MKCYVIECRPYIVETDGNKAESSMPTNSMAFESFDDLMEHYNRYSLLTYIEPEDLEAVKNADLESGDEVKLFDISFENMDGSETIIDYIICIKDIDL